jgi:lysozyme
MFSSFTSSDFSRLDRQIKESEGLRLDAYRCGAGALTVGYGHNCDASPVDGVARVGDRITREEAGRIFLADRDGAVRAVRGAFPCVDALCAPRQAVLYDMAFNMGLGMPGVSGLLSFRHTLSMIANGRYAEAARSMLQSRWARQVKLRAVRLSLQMETGEWQ